MFVMEGVAAVAEDGPANTVAAVAVAVVPAVTRAWRRETAPPEVVGFRPWTATANSKSVQQKQTVVRMKNMVLATCWRRLVYSSVGLSLARMLNLVVGCA